MLYVKVIHKFTSTDPKSFSYEETKPYLISANGGGIVVEKRVFEGDWTAVDGSPVTPGKDLRIETHTINNVLRMTPSAIGTVMALSPID